LIKVCFLAVVALWSIEIAIRYGRQFYKYIIPHTFLNKAIGLFVLVSFLSVLFSVDFLYSQRVFFERYLPYIIFFFLGAGLSKKSLNYAKILIGVFLLSSCILGIGSIWDFIVLNPGRLFTSFGIKFLSIHYYYTLAASLGIIVFLFERNKVLKIIAGISGLFCFFSLIFNFYRGAVWGFILAVSSMSWFRKKRLAIFILIAIILFSLFFISDRYNQRFLTAFDTDRWGDRIPMWKSAVSMFLDYPFFGVGIRKYRDFMFIYEPEPNSIGRNLNHAHNTYFQILAEQGILGLLAFLYIFWTFFRNVLKKRYKIIQSKDSGIILGIVGMIFACLFSGVSSVLFILLPGHTSMLWILFGVGVGSIDSLG
jgi:O-antigen ligase